MLVTMQNSELIDKLVLIANGDLRLVEEAIRVCAEGQGEADLKMVVDYIVKHRQSEKIPAVA